ncbi:MAG TPA: hypothetical protein VJJ82_01400 [Candidatus Nanoarchaeia archaeon]|nr:hypothetical protein [Candidatus Nanoarchaeia archaeon]
MTDSSEERDIHYCRIEKDGRSLFIGAYKSGVTEIDEETLKKILGPHSEMLTPTL